VTPDDPQFTSPDDRYHWDGQSWVAVPPEPASFFAAPVAQILPTHQAAKIWPRRVGLQRIWREQPLTVAIAGLAVGALVASIAVVGLSTTASHPAASPLAAPESLASSVSPTAARSAAGPTNSSTPSSATTGPSSVGPAPAVSPATPPASTTAPSQSPTAYALTGTIVVNAATARTVTYSPPDAIFTNSDYPTCTSKRDDIQVGTVATVRDENGTIIGTGDIGTSNWINLKTVSDPGMSDGGIPGDGVPPSVSRDGDCALGLTVPDLPPATFYTVQIGLTTQNISLAEMQRSGWSLSMDLHTY
jgi:hypothetical protein